MEIDIKEYFTEIIDESRSTIGYSLNPYKDIDLVKAIYEQNEQLQQLKQENEELKEKIIKLNEENGNLIINRNTVENKLQDTESRLISIQKANTHNLVLLQTRNNTLEEIEKELKEDITCESRECGCDDYGECLKCIKETILNRINEVKNE